jgi:tetratricopeptide (TPR) repeat protein
MKKFLLFFLLAVSALAGWLVYAPKTVAPPLASSPAHPTPAQLAAGANPKPNAQSSEVKSTSPVTIIMPKEDSTESAELATLRIAVSPQTTFDEKLAAWNKIRDAGQLDHAIAELEKTAANNPTTPELFVALGHAYMVKSGTVSDIAQVGALGLKIDQAFTTALTLDPANWEAQYSKAVSLSYYPAFMNKQKDTIATFSALIQQQEQSPPQPEFANTYLRLGNEYQKQGNTDAAAQTWQRGAQLFPDNTDLRQKVTPPAPAQP